MFVFIKSFFSRKKLKDLLLIIVLSFLIRTSLIYIFALNPSNLLDCYLFGIPAALCTIYITKKRKK
jgi:hypothetical protein